MTPPPRHLAPGICRLGLFLAAWLFAVCPVSPQEETGPVVRLPDLKVTARSELPAMESWRYTRVGQFEVLANTADRTAQSLLADFAKFTQAVALVWPAPLKPIAGASIILCGRDGKFDQFPPTGSTADGAVVPGVFLRNREQIALVIDVESSRLALDPANLTASGTGAADYAVDHYRQLYREYVHYLLSQSQARPPIWVEEGLAQIVMDIELSDTTLLYGKIDTYKGAETGGDLLESDGPEPAADSVVGEQPFNVVLRHTKLIPWDKFFALTADSPEARHPLGNNLWAKQAYAFVHFCLFGENLRHQQALRTFINRLAREPLSEALFKECFKVGYADMTKQVDGYIRYTKHKYQKYNLQKADQFTARSIELREATPGEVALIKGDALRLAGHHDRAIEAYQSAGRHGEHDALLQAGLGLSETALHHSERARPLLENSIQASVSRPSAYVEVARLRLTAASARPAAANGRLSAGQMTAVLSPLFEGRKLPPPLPETYELIASAWSQSAVAPTRDNLAVLDEGIRAFPRQSTLLYAAAQLYLQAGAPATAAAIAKLGLRYSTDPAVQAQFNQLLAGLPAPAVAK